jgi:hypothetical protein
MDGIVAGEELYGGVNVRMRVLIHGHVRLLLRGER